MQVCRPRLAVEPCPILFRTHVQTQTNIYIYIYIYKYINTYTNVSRDDDGFRQAAILQVRSWMSPPCPACWNRAHSPPWGRGWWWGLTNYKVSKRPWQQHKRNRVARVDWHILIDALERLFVLFSDRSDFSPWFVRGIKTQPPHP